MNILPVYKASFFLSQQREDGLKLRVIYAGDHVYTDFQIGEQFQSETDSLYNGILFGIMDVLMWYAILMQTKKMCMTKKIDIEFLESISCNVPYRAKSKLLNADEKDIHVTAWIEDNNGQVYSKVTALFREGRGMNASEIINNFDFSETTPEMKEFFDSFLK
jgi:acyl-coenzyme A thioesterase PaaI-like protein